MSRKHITQLFPFLLPLRLRQQKTWYYAKMQFDGNHYSTHREPSFGYELFSGESLLINEHTGADICYQYNKVHNLRIASMPVNHLVIHPGETFSLWWVVRNADRKESYRNGLCVHNGELVGVYGGGLCQLSNMLFWLFLHSPLSIVERHMHKIKEFPNPSPDDLCGVDATILEGWLDLKARNDTNDDIQIELTMDDSYYRGRVLLQRPPVYVYDVVNRNLNYFTVGEKSYESVDVIRQTHDASSGKLISEETLYTNKCEIGYDLSTQYI